MQIGACDMIWYRGQGRYYLTKSLSLRMASNTWVLCWIQTVTPSNIGYGYSKDKERDKQLGQSFSFKKGKSISLKRSTAKHPSVLAFNSIYPQGHFDKNQKEMFLFSVDNKQACCGNPIGKMEGHFSSKGIRRLGNKKIGFVFQNPSCKNLVEIIPKYGLTLGRDHVVQIVLKIK